MYLKSIEIYGFKSFAGKIKINFNPNITVIVGPNGCGKSNIADAIKWCIGEMSWKSLRMPSMVDVIFAGTTKRQPLNLAEVTLIFDNQERKLNLNFSEVAITRKIYRSEESEYFINRTECRLKDIRDMFLDTGIGSSGYSIIGQGEIERVLNTTPEKLREIFEEVAGVSRYKSKREEALKKMEKVDYDLSLLSGNMEIINEQIKKLDSEAKKAKLQQKYKEELREAEISLILKEIKNNKLEIEKENNALSPIVEELTEINSGLSAAETELSALNISLTEKSEEEKRIFEDISTIKSNITKIEGNRIKDEELISEYISQISRIEENEKKITQLQEKILPEIEEKKRKLEELIDSHKQLKTDYENILDKLKNIEEDLANIDRQIQEKEKEIKEIYQNQLDTTKKMALIQSDITNARADIISFEKEKKQLETEKINLETENKNLSIKLNELKSSLAQLNSKKENINAQKDSLKSQLKEVEEKISALNIKNSSDKARLETLKSQAEKDSYWNGVQAILSAQISGVKGTLRHILRFDRENKIFIEDAFGKFLDAIVVDNESIALKCIEHLKYTKQGRCRFIILDKIPVINPESKKAFSVLDKVNFDQEYFHLVNFLAGNITLSSNEVSGDFWIAGGIENASTGEDYWQDIETLKLGLEKNEKDLQSLISEKENLLGEIARLENEIEAIDKEISAFSIDIPSFENELKRIFEKIEIKNKNLEMVVNEISARDKIVTENLETEKNLKVELEMLNKRQNEIMEFSASLKNKRMELEKQNLSLKEEVGFKSSNISGFQNDLEKLKDEIKDLEDRLAETKLEKENISNRKKELNGKIEELKNAVAKYKIQEIEERNNLKELEIKKTNIENEIEKIKNDIERLNHIIKENKELWEENFTKKQEIELKINTYSTRIEDLMKRLENDWQLKYEEIKDKDENQNIDIERINFLRKRIENMGNVNMTAPQEYETLITKYNLINSQIEDLNKAKSDLKSAINRINETTRENFKKTFDSVQNYFKQIYSTLFNGGEANLILTNPDNLLETGIEIMAHPPGKKLVSISQLSGGEKSLTALALLFSFFCVNPSPFCIMDEVDSALDEANVERFVKLIKEFSTSTQFILITHNKRTMEIADIMYGVTMEESGVSKIISVDLKRAIEISQSATTAGAKI